MNRYRFVGFIVFIIGVVCLNHAFLQGELEVGIALFIPFIIGSGLYSFVGMLCIFCSFVLFMISWSKVSFVDQYSNGTDSKKSKVESGGLILIGPFPIVFGSNKNIAFVLLGVAIILFLLLWFISIFLY